MSILEELTENLVWDVNYGITPYKLNPETNTYELYSEEELNTVVILNSFKLYVYGGFTEDILGQYGEVLYFLEVNNNDYPEYIYIYSLFC